MAIDFQQVRDQIQKMGENAPALAQQRSEQRRLAAETLQDVAHSQALLREKVQAALTFNPHLRTALPAAEPLDTHLPIPAIPAEATLLAADGSQIFPDRHSPLYFSLINVGAICMRLGQASAPQLTVRSRLLHDEEMYTENGRITERLLALMRDLGERELLAELAADLPAPVLTLTDGPLELWEARDGAESQKTYDEKFDRYIEALRSLHTLGASTAGYIDKPGSDLVVRLLEIATLKATELQKAGRAHRPFRGLTDVELLRDVVGTYERSAIFGIQSSNSGKYANELALHFFYLNVGSDASGRPYLARVEVPAWVADDPAAVDTLHAVLIAQCRTLGTRPFPYLLHRSHEVALVSLDEKQQVETMIAIELRKHGIEVGPQSHKSVAKEAGGRSRYS